LIFLFICLALILSSSIVFKKDNRKYLYLQHYYGLKIVVKKAV